MPDDPPTYVVVGSKPWNRRVFDERISSLPGQWHYLDDRTAVSAAYLRGLAPRRIFFLHWSYRVPEEVVSAFECVNFHMTDLPYGRGGSPLQNLVAAGHRVTKMTAHRMTEDLDAGDVYLKEDLDLCGTAEDVYVRATELSAEMIRRINAEGGSSTPQEGEPVVFRRRRPSQSRIDGIADLRRLYDHIRMLDADGYPAAFLEIGELRFEFRRAALYEGEVVADVVITRRDAG